MLLEVLNDLLLAGQATQLSEEILEDALKKFACVGIFSLNFDICFSLWKEEMLGQGIAFSIGPRAKDSADTPI